MAGNCLPDRQIADETPFGFAQDKPALPSGTPLWVNSFGIHEKPTAAGGDG
jgi:hypothetical protein